MEEENVYKKYLPLGTVVLLENANKKVSIIGFRCVGQNDKVEKEFDYAGCLYPEGVVTSSKSILFNHDQIKKVCNIGYSDEEDKAFKRILEEEKNK